MKYSSVVLSRLQAVEALAQHPTPVTKTTLMETILNKNFFYMVKLKAAESLVKVKITENIESTMYSAQIAISIL